MRKLLLVVALLMISSPSVVRAQAPPLATQMVRSRVIHGSALERLIQQNQQFNLLAAPQLRTKLDIPLWLRVHYRKHHPQALAAISPRDPTGGFPLALDSLHVWMIHHQDLKPSIPPAPAAPRALAGENVRISGAQESSRSESDIRVNYFDPHKIIAASNNIAGAGGQAQFYSTDGGVTWGQTTLPIIQGDSLHSDPTVDWTSDGTGWATTIGISADQATLQMRAYQSTDGGVTWTFDATFSGDQTAADKQMMWVDHSKTSPYKDTIYVIWHNNEPAYVNRRTAGPSGKWQTPIRVSKGETQGTAIGGDIKTNSRGDVFAFWPATGNQRLLVTKSTDGGASFGNPVVIGKTFGSFQVHVPAFAERGALIGISGGAYREGAKDLVYATWMDLSGEDGCQGPDNEPGTDASSSCKMRIWFARSTDGGAHWEQPKMINNQHSRNDQFNQKLLVDETDGTLAVIYYDTVRDQDRKKTDLFFQSSHDDGATWSDPLRVTTKQTDETVVSADSGNQYGDYNGLAGFSGKFFPSWTDRRSGAREEIYTAPITDTAGPDGRRQPRLIQVGPQHAARGK